MVNARKSWDKTPEGENNMDGKRGCCQSGPKTNEVNSPRGRAVCRDRRPMRWTPADADLPRWIHNSILENRCGPKDAI